MQETTASADTGIAVTAGVPHLPSATSQAFASCPSVVAVQGGRTLVRLRAHFVEAQVHAMAGRLDEGIRRLCRPGQLYGRCV